MTGLSVAKFTECDPRSRGADGYEAQDGRVSPAMIVLARPYCSLRVGKSAWKEFVDDVERKKAISLSPSEIW